MQHLVRMGVSKNWLQLDTVVGYTRSYLRDWVCHQPEITTDMEMGELFLLLYPEGIPHQNDRRFVEDATAEETWTGEVVVEVHIDKEDEPPPLEPQNPSQGTPRTTTPDDKRLDWGEDDLSLLMGKAFNGVGPCNWTSTTRQVGDLIRFHVMYTTRNWLLIWFKYISQYILFLTGRV